MPYVDDLIADNRVVKESSCADIVGRINLVDNEVASTLFPGVAIPQSKNIVYFEFAFCNSLPKVNERGRAFTPRVLQRSVASLQDQLIDHEHFLEDNGIGGRDKVIGHVKATRFNLPADYKDTEVASIATPVPAYGLGALFLRASGVKKIVEENQRRGDRWKTSMECGHKWSEAMFLYDDKFIPVKDADRSMRDCVQPNAITQYKGRKLAACLGGLDSQVDFWGLGITQNPADGDSDILGFYAGRGPELASKKVFYMPMHSFYADSLEVASKTVDKMSEECASISVIGKTKPDKDGGHAHEVLSNLQILPHNGHSHSYGNNFMISRGSKPRLTGLTGDHTEHPMHEVSSGKSYTHSHLIDVPLKGKYDPTCPYGDNDDCPTGLDMSLASILKKEDHMTLEELLKKLNEGITTLVSLKDANEIASKQLEISGVQKEIASLNQSNVAEAERKSYLEGLVKDGKYLTREKANEEITIAVKAQEDKDKELLKQTEVRNRRAQKCLEAKVDLNVEFEDILGTDGKPMTVGKQLEMIPTDDAGEKMFQMNFAAWSTNPGIVAVEEVKTEVVKTEVVTQVAEAASKGAKRSIKSLIGGGAGGASNSGGGSQEVANTGVPAHLMGKRAIKARLQQQ